MAGNVLPFSWSSGNNVSSSFYFHYWGVGALMKSSNQVKTSAWWRDELLFKWKAEPVSNWPGLQCEGHYLPEIKKGREINSALNRNNSSLLLKHSCFLWTALPSLSRGYCFCRKPLLVWWEHWSKGASQWPRITMHWAGWAASSSSWCFAGGFVFRWQSGTFCTRGTFEQLALD